MNRDKIAGPDIGVSQGLTHAVRSMCERLAGDGVVRAVAHDRGNDNLVRLLDADAIQDFTGCFQVNRHRIHVRKW